LKDLGVTHIVYETNAAPAHTRQEEAIFAAFALPNSSRERFFGGMRLFALPPDPPLRMRRPRPTSGAVSKRFSSSAFCTCPCSGSPVSSPA
jgi:hypothetical protein